jgi:hypothetical protein
MLIAKNAFHRFFAPLGRAYSEMSTRAARSFRADVRRFSYLINLEQVFSTHNHLLTLLIVIMGGPQRMIATRRCSPRTSSEAANEITK